MSVVVVATIHPWRDCRDQVIPALEKNTGLDVHVLAPHPLGTGEQGQP